MADKGGITINFDDDEVLEVADRDDDDLELGAADKLKLQLGAMSAQMQMNRRRTAAIVGAAFVIAFLCIIVTVFGIYLLLDDLVDDNGDLDFEYSKASTETFYTKKITIMPSMHWEGQLVGLTATPDLERPSGDLAIRQVKFTVVTPDGDEVPLEQVYNHHILLYNEHGETIAAIGAEGDRSSALRLPNPYAVISPKKEKWSMGVHLVNVWGLASGANMTVRIGYEVTYTSTSKSIVPVNWYLLGPTDNSNIVFDVASDSDDSAAVEVFDYDLTWDGGDGIFVVTMGHVHIGAVNCTLYDVDNDRVIASSEPVYSPTGYIVALGRDYPMYEITQGTHLRISSTYSKAHNWQDVMSLFQVFGTFDENFLVGDSTDEEEYYFEYQAFTSLLSFSWANYVTESEGSPVADSPALSASAQSPKSDSAASPRSDSAASPRSDSAASPGSDSAASPRSDSAQSPQSASAVSDSAVSDSAVSDSAVSDSAVSDSAVSESAVSDSAASDSAVSESAVSASAVTASDEEVTVSDEQSSDAGYADYSRGLGAAKWLRERLL